MVTHTVKIDVAICPFFVTVKLPTPWYKKLRQSMLMCLRQLLYIVFITRGAEAKESEDRGKLFS